MTGEKFAELVREYANADSVTLPDSTLCLLANPVKNDLCQDISNLVGEKYFELPTETSLVADQREYDLPQDMLNSVTGVNAQLDGTNWIRLYNVGIENFDHALDETHIVANYANSEGDAGYLIRRSSLYLLTGTITDVTDGLKIWYNVPFPDFTASVLAETTTDLAVPLSDTQHGLPTAVQEVVARETAFRYKANRDEKYKPNDLELRLHVPVASAREGDWLKAIKSLRRTDESEIIPLTSPNLSDLGDYGFDY